VKPHFNVTAALIMRNGRLLIARRPDGTHMGGLWEFPGGKQERGETLEECLVREILEETGATVLPGKCIFVAEHEYESRRVTLHFFRCALPDHGPLRGLEGQELRWVRPEELARFNFPPPDSSLVRRISSGRRP
jgi:8-oxo-dGTP diphosphatase